ncbi:MAG: hypothetical protein HZB19_11160 [Chloroflexi bacterium]|nr:hypothetical protein [Chloroflexota bacterium]
MDKVAFQKLTDEMMVFYTEGKYVDALHLVELNADRFPEQSARTTFWKMCLLSLCGRADDVISVFQQGLDSGLWWAEDQFGDSDLDAVCDLPEFKRLMAESDQKCLEMQKHIQPDRALLVPDDTSRALPLLIALHGRNGHKDYNLERWDVARQRGWLVLSPQSMQALFPGSYSWDDNDRGLADILFHFEEIAKTYDIDRSRIVVGGFSQGGGLSAYTALSGKVGARGFIGVAAYIFRPASLAPLAREARSVRGYFITGEKDNSLDTIREIQGVLKENWIQFAEEVYPDLGHEFPSDFEKLFDQAIGFIFKEHE